MSPVEKIIGESLEEAAVRMAAKWQERCERAEARELDLSIALESVHVVLNKALLRYKAQLREDPIEIQVDRSVRQLPAVIMTGKAIHATLSIPDDRELYAEGMNWDDDIRIEKNDTEINLLELECFYTYPIVVNGG